MSADGPSPKVLILTGEFSGNIYGAQVARELRQACPGIRLHGVGCQQMRDEGVELLYDCSSWGAVGLVEAAKRPQLLWIFQRLKAWIRDQRPDVVLLLDYPGFNMAATRFARSLGIPAVYFFPPGKHTTDPEQVARSARQISRVATPLPTTFDLYETAGANVEFVGHPLIDMMSDAPSREEARKAIEVDPGTQLVGILPGSRLQEIHAHTPVMLEVVRRLAVRFPRMWFALPRVSLQEPAVEEEIDAILSEVRRSGLPVKILAGRSHEVMAASDTLVIASGTATLEAAFMLTPMVIVYRVSFLTAVLATLFYKRFPRFMGLPNILADRMIVPELIQRGFTVEETVCQVRRFFDEPEYRAQVVAELQELREKLGKPGAARRVARMVLEEAGVEPVQPWPEDTVRVPPGSEPRDEGEHAAEAPSPETT